jgi:ABC-2 type transport system ATP-binding protein
MLSSNIKAEHAIEVLGLTKSFKIKRSLHDKELGLVNFLKRFMQKSETMDSILAIDNISFEIEKGELFGLLGPNGAGKTTLTKTLCTLLWPNGGTARVNGYDIRTESSKVRSSLGTVLDVRMGWHGRLSCRQNLLFYAQLYGIPPSNTGKRIRETLELVGLGDKMDEWQQKLSSGMQRKLDVARALLPDPPVLLLDEPTIQLDPKSARDFRTTVKNELCVNQGKTIMWTTHNMYEAEEICDRVAIMHKGKIIAIGRPDEIKGLIKSNESVIADVQNPTPQLLDSIRNLQNVVALTSTPQSSDVSQLRIEVTDTKISPLIAETIMKNKGLLFSLRIEEPTLEQALIKLTGEK